MIVLDTNVISELMKTRPERAVVEWLDSCPRESVWTTSITVFELRFGLEILPPGKRRAALASSLERLLSEKIRGRVAVFDEAAASSAAQLVARRRAGGRAGDLRDSMIAGIVLSSRAMLATRNVVHFEDLAVPVVNPWVARG